VFSPTVSVARVTSGAVQSTQHKQRILILKQLGLRQATISIYKGMIVRASPEAIFLPKFENASASTRDLYAKLDTDEKHIFVAAVKSSGSLWIASCRDGVLIATSKNGTGNVYSSAGHYALVCRLQEQFKSDWRQAYDNLLSFLEQNSLSLGCELVTRCLGDHASVPRHDHLVVNAILNKNTMQPCSPMAIIDVCRNFRLLTPGLYVFSSPTHFLDTYQRFQHDPCATWADVSSAMKQSAWRSFPMQYETMHSHIVEGFVCSMVPRSARLMQWLASEPDDCVADAFFPAGGMPGMLKSVSVLYEDCGSSLDALHTHMEQQLDAAGVASRTMIPAPVDEVFALIRRADREGESEGTAMFRSMAQALESLSIPHAFKCFRERTGYLVCVHVLQDWGFARYEKERAMRGETRLPPLLRGNTWHVSVNSTTTPAYSSQRSGSHNGPSTQQSVIMRLDEASLSETPHRDKKRMDDSASRDDSPQPLKMTKRASKCSMPDALEAPGAVPGSIFKFKFLSYTHRTFLLRNCGCTLAKTSDMGAPCLRSRACPFRANMHRAAFYTPVCPQRTTPKCFKKSMQARNHPHFRRRVAWPMLHHRTPDTTQAAQHASEIQASRYA
jgi:hypothetical protein